MLYFLGRSLGVLGLAFSRLLQVYRSVALSGVEIQAAMG